MSGGFSAAYEQLLPEFERTSGIKVTTGSGASQGTGPQTIGGQLSSGATADVVILSREGLEELVAAKRIATGTDVNLARVGLGVAVRAGTPKPDVSTVEAFKQALLKAKTVGYIDPASGGSSGIYVADLLVKLGIADQIKPKAKLQKGGHVSDLVSAGEAEIGIHQIGEIIGQPGVTLVGPLPAEIQNYTVYAVGVGAHAKDAEAAKAFIKVLTGPSAAGVLKSKGLEGA